MTTNAELESLGLSEEERIAYWQDQTRIAANKKADATYKSEKELAAATATALEAPK
ncbi:hypothetical protein ANME2D_02331 [Candidatus Methanoperedens nitroreducens]|uniref:Uncharacterized protein n=1 Tax=Candidatus Methanoperedens nitratireducens TaxID=1392998 RepID=A0A062UX74_9EURY|nr:hypothetical protein [Candidatus Methanoperedens nitroreducens]KCZ71596.1 hypothetical protein ANME2D_02331 [Candidatus Methanoperedens nitroreducens]MDJ1421226.1 hypothetical protein [Candidatus Methanoperedens sp.]